MWSAAGSGQKTPARTRVCTDRGSAATSSSTSGEKITRRACSTRSTAAVPHAAHRRKPLTAPG
eukprot:3526324-Prymnesium_polylepis.1